MTPMLTSLGPLLLPLPFFVFHHEYTLPEPGARGGKRVIVDLALERLERRIDGLEQKLHAAAQPRRARIITLGGGDSGQTGQALGHPVPVAKLAAAG